MNDNDETQREIDSIRNDKTHPWHRGDKAAQEYVDSLYQRKYGYEKINSFQPGEKERMQRDYERTRAERKAGPERAEPQATEPARQETQPSADYDPVAYERDFRNRYGDDAQAVAQALVEEVNLIPEEIRNGIDTRYPGLLQDCDIIDYLVERNQRRK